jgi:hypothetical protein
MMVLKLTWDPPTPKVGDHVTFTVTITNIGPQATPANTIVDCLFTVNDVNNVTQPDASGGNTWTDVYTTAIPSGQQVTLTANGGSGPNNQSYWVPSNTGVYTVSAYVNSNTRFPEMDRANNTTTFNIVVGTGAPSAPLAPTLTGTPGNNTVALTWTAPYDGGLAITNYRVYRGGTLLTTLGVVQAYNDTTAVNGTTYSYTVSAVNALGEGAQSSFVSVTPVAASTPPGTPINVLASAGNASAQVTWTAPANGGSPITGYTVTPFIGTTAQTPVTVTGSPPTTTANLSGLTNGTSYTFQVTATNAVGTSGFGTSNAVTPAVPNTAPAAPVLTATAGTSVVNLSWTVPNNGGSAITSYRIYRNGILLTTVAAP